MTLESKSNTGNTWRFYMESPDDTDPTPVLGNTGTLNRWSLVLQGTDAERSAKTDASGNSR